MAAACPRTAAGAGSKGGSGRGAWRPVPTLTSPQPYANSTVPTCLRPWARAGVPSVLQTLSRVDILPSRTLLTGGAAGVSWSSCLSGVGSAGQPSDCAHSTSWGLSLKPTQSSQLAVNWAAVMRGGAGSRPLVASGDSWGLVGVRLCPGTHPHLHVHGPLGLACSSPDILPSLSGL